jgi:signal transduction histidine kinase
LVAAKMDLGYLEATLGTQRPDLRPRFAQVRECLDTAIAVERRVVEELQPGLLVHIGLFAALRWLIEQPRSQANRHVHLQVPESEAPLPLPARVALYRAVQETLSLTCGDIDLMASVSAQALRLVISRLRVESGAGCALRLLAVLHRVHAVGGSTELANVAPEGRRLTIELPLAVPPDSPLPTVRRRIAK